MQSSAPEQARPVLLAMNIQARTGGGERRANKKPTQSAFKGHGFFKILYFCESVVVMAR